jgi:hypothetical protein
VLAGLALAVSLAGVALGVFTDHRTNPQTLTAASTWPTPTPTPTPTPAPGNGLKALYKNNTPSFPADNAITPWLQLVNGASGPLDLALMKARYWFTKDASSTAVNVYCDYAWLDCTPTGKVTASVVAVSPARPGADTYVEVAFKSNAGQLAAGATTYEIQLRIHKADYTPFDETNDFSYGTNGSYQDGTKVTVYYAGKLVWGTEP